MATAPTGVAKKVSDGKSASASGARPKEKMAAKAELSEEDLKKVSGGVGTVSHGGGGGAG